jgi:hypothetical protein
MVSLSCLSKDQLFFILSKIKSFGEIPAGKVVKTAFCLGNDVPLDPYFGHQVSLDPSLDYNTHLWLAVSARPMTCGLHHGNSGTA